MPRFDGTGPNGQGPLTGKGMGVCNGGSVGFQGGFGRRMGRCMRMGGGFMRGFFSSQPTKSEQKKMLKEEIKMLDEEKREIEKMLEEIN